MEKGAERDGKWSAAFDFAGILGILDPETGKNGRPFPVSFRSFFHGVPSEKNNLMTLDCCRIFFMGMNEKE